MMSAASGDGSDDAIESTVADVGYDDDAAAKHELLLQLLLLRVVEGDGLGSVHPSTSNRVNGRITFTTRHRLKMSNLLTVRGDIVVVVVVVFLLMLDLILVAPVLLLLFCNRLSSLPPPPAADAPPLLLSCGRGR